MCIEFNMYNFHIFSITYHMFALAGRGGGGGGWSWARG